MNDAESFNDIASHVFAKAYPAIAAQVVADTGISNGICLDVGCGCGHLGLAMARQGNFEIIALDPSDEMLKIASRNAADTGLSARVKVIQGSAETIPLPDDSVDLVVSRGSIFFWTDLKRAFLEMYRVLKPSGMVYVGGGFGSAEIRESVIRMMKERNGGKDTFVESMKKRAGSGTGPDFRRALEAADIPGARVDQSAERGIWVVFGKGSMRPPQNDKGYDCELPRTAY